MSNEKSDAGSPECSWPLRAVVAFVVVKGDALDQTGDFLGHEFVFGYCGAHLVGKLFSQGRSACVEQSSIRGKVPV